MTSDVKPIHSYMNKQRISILCFVLLASPVFAQIAKDFKMVNATMEKGELVIKPSQGSSQHDFDFLAGKWTMDNKRLKTRLNKCTEWVEYPSTSDNLGTLLNGIGNFDIYRTQYNQVNNATYEGITLRLFNPKTRLWSLYWVDSNQGVL